MSGGYIHFPGLLSLIGDRSGIWTQIHLTSNPEPLGPQLYVSSTIFHGSNELKPVEKSSLCLLSLHGAWADSVLFPKFLPCSPFIHQNRKKCLLYAKWCDWHWLNFAQRKRSLGRDWPQNSFTNWGAEMFKKSTNSLYVHFSFLSFSFGCAILNAESYFPFQESNLCPFIGGLTTGLPGKSLFIFYCKHNRYSLKKVETTKKSIKKEMSPTLLTFWYVCWNKLLTFWYLCWKNFPPIYREKYKF